MKCKHHTECNNKVTFGLSFYDENTGKLTSNVYFCNIHMNECLSNFTSVVLNEIAEILVVPEIKGHKVS